MKILLIDDSKTMREIIRSVLVQIDDVEVCEAVGGHEGLALAASAEPDLVLVDQLMPEVDGLQFIRAFRERNTRTPIILLGCSNDRRQVVEAIRAGANNFLAKPFTPDLLGQRVRETMEALSPPTIRVAS
ncbi:MAG: response regulator [Phycisphaerales bacterium]